MAQEGSSLTTSEVIVLRLSPYVYNGEELFHFDKIYRKSIFIISFAGNSRSRTLEHRRSAP